MKFYLIKFVLHVISLGSSNRIYLVEGYLIDEHKFVQNDLSFIWSLIDVSEWNPSIDIIQLVELNIGEKNSFGIFSDLLFKFIWFIPNEWNNPIEILLDLSNSYV